MQSLYGVYCTVKNVAREYSVNTYAVQCAVNGARSIVQPYIDEEFEATEICKGVWIGNFASATNKYELQRLGITHIVVAAYGLWEVYPGDFKYKRIDVIDSNYSSMTKYFADVADYIHELVTSGRKVLVHCVAGVSRSATLVAAYLILTQGYTADDAVTVIRRSRPQVQPNEAFMSQLKTLTPGKYFSFPVTESLPNEITYNFYGTSIFH